MKSKALSALLFIFCFLYFSIAIYYYTTGTMGTMFWVLVLVPIGFTIYTLTKLKKGELYPRLGKLQYLVGAVYISLCLFSAIYLPTNYLDLIYYRAGSYNVVDKFVGVAMFLLIAEYARREHKVLFGLLLFLIVYCMFGDYFPGILRVPSIDLERLILSSTVEIKLGMFGTYAQAGVGIIGAFLLLMGVAKGFGVDRALIKTIISTLGKRPTLIPQSAVLGSMSVAMCTGSGAADSALVGQFTIPAMKRAGFPALYAAATEGSAALGGLIMPPVMAIAAFLMAEFLAVSYFEVMIRGFVLAFIYYISIVLTVYLLTLHYVKPGKIVLDDVFSQLGKVTKTEKLCAVIFFIALVLLIVLMGYFWWPEVRAALVATLAFMIAVSLVTFATEGSSLVEKFKNLGKSLKETVESYPEIIVDILLLLALLGIIINLFTVTGWLLKLGMSLVALGRENLLLLVALGFLLAFFLGFGLPPSAVYIIASVLVVPSFIFLEFSPWVAHFFVFLVAAISEFTPPVALIAAVTSKIAETSFIKTAFYTQKWILPIYLLIFAVITWPELVVAPGTDMLLAFAIVLIGCLTVTAGSFGKLSKNRFIDIPARLVLIALGLFVLYAPQKDLAMILAPILAFLVVLSTRATQKISRDTQ
ncbi:MAG: TRAP transporter fused permease subunit [Archaeoglobaceae archaeon]